MDLRLPSEQDPFLRAIRHLAGWATRYHRARLEGAEHLPDGPVLLVGNHGLLGFETPVFFYLLHRATGRFPVGLSDRMLFDRPPIRPLLERVGGIPGTRENAIRLLEGGQLVVCYPGGSRETFKRPADHYRLRWERSIGFAKLAIRLGVPIVPFAGLGVDSSYLNFGPPPVVSRFFGRYAAPMAVGLGPLPLPVPFRFRLGPVLPPPSAEAEAPTFKTAVKAAVELLLGDGSPETNTARRFF